MESFNILFLLITIIGIGHSLALTTISPKLYWESMLPTTPLPKAILALLQPDFFFSPKSHNGNPSLYIEENAGQKYAYVDHPHSQNSNVSSIFFLDNMLSIGSTYNLYFLNISSKNSPFLVRVAANKYPFSSNKLLDILARFSIKPNTDEAKLIENTIMDCEVPPIKGEERYCATSLESMVDVVIMKMGKEVKVMSATVEDGMNPTYSQVSTVVEKSKVNNLLCHKETYPYAVFYCHSNRGTRVYEVGFIDKDGKRANVLAVCHNDTSGWDPKHFAFKYLKVKPGGATICHFLPPYDLAFFV
ncbi:BURP domain-containing protein 5-like [Cucumis melo]|uniref:BURP domain-containing protein 5-like n=1 Tax=Cucumis melo TaxID=3656 RepID=A0ABM3KTX8_CUCME|nr:BURP domain-containing protein 5-like [Cucumis melo]